MKQSKAYYGYEKSQGHTSVQTIMHINNKNKALTCYALTVMLHIPG
jgi:hypothetical protein